MEWRSEVNTNFWSVWLDRYGNTPTLGLARVDAGRRTGAVGATKAEAGLAEAVADAKPRVTSYQLSSRSSRTLIRFQENRFCTVASAKDAVPVECALPHPQENQEKKS